MRFSALLAFLFAAATLAQQPAGGLATPDIAPAQDATPTLHISGSVVLVPVQVQTRRGEMIYGLKPQQFTLTDNGVPQTIHVDEDTDALGLSLVVVVQCSREAFRQFDSMRGLTAMVDDLAGGAPKQVAVMQYGNEPELIGKFTDDQARLDDNLARLQPCEDGGAVTLDAVDFANKLFDSTPATSSLTRNRRAILLISETRDHGSRIKAETVVAELGRSNTVVDAVSFDPGKTSVVDSLIHGRGGPGPMGLIFAAVQAVRKNVPHSLAGLTGGEYTNFTTARGFDQGVHRLANHIHNYYLLSFQPPVDVAPGLHQLQVKVPDYADAQIRSRLTYYAGDAPPPEIPEK